MFCVFGIVFNSHINIYEREVSTCPTSGPLGVAPACCNASVSGTFISLLCVLDRKLNVHCGPGLRMLNRCVDLRAPVAALSLTSYSSVEPQEHSPYSAFSIRPECPGAI